MRMHENNWCGCTRTTGAEAREQLVRMHEGRLPKSESEGKEEAITVPIPDTKINVFKW